MPELLQILADDFELTVWVSDISRRQATYRNTVATQTLSNTRPQLPEIRLSNPAVEVRILEEVVGGDPVSSLQLPAPLFFENTEYHFEWVFKSGVSDAQLAHRRQQLNDCFRFVPARAGLPARLTGHIQTGNDVGWLRLPLRYRLNGVKRDYAISLEVLPTKLLLQRDLPLMYRAIDESFPLWRFNLAGKTHQEAANSRQRGNFPLLWLAQFARLRQELEQGLKVICQAPHSRLQTQVSHIRADRLKGRIANRLGEQVREELRNKRPDRRYRVERKHLSVNTPENRFIKMVVTNSCKQLSGFEKRLRASNLVPDRQRLSEAFLDELRSWQSPMREMLERSFLKDVADYNGISRESLVLHQKTGYSIVYRVWQELKLYLDVLSGQAQISMKSVAEIYEIWCFLRIRQMLLDHLGFTEVIAKRVGLELNDFFEYQLRDGFAGAFEFQRADGVTARLVHEPKFTRYGKSIRSYLVTQQPDIVLEVTVPAEVGGAHERRFIWLFDAKYRIKAEAGRHDYDDVDSADYVPDDAINQMHRYRDALIALHDASAHKRKSRPVFGAFALYPGYFPQENNSSENPYAEAIKEIGIGAFPLLPDALDSNSGSYWLLDFLSEQINGGGKEGVAAHLYIQEAARIPVYGMVQTLHPDLCMTAALGGAAGRSKEYMQGFEEGTACWYHMPQSTFTNKYKRHVVEEIRYLALARTPAGNVQSKQIEYIWPVLKITLVPRYAINLVQAGRPPPASAEPYYLFSLGRPLRLHSPVHGVPHRPIKKSMKLTRLVFLQKQGCFSKLEEVYPGALNTISSSV